MSWMDCEELVANILLFDSVFDWDDGNNDDFIGYFEASVNDLIKASGSRTGFPVYSAEAARKKKNYVNSGTIYVDAFSVGTPGV